ncbi:hypothetical protein L249_4268 [Ophiocordyceps polyrhachis-furcata BCC 54312]|uniref:RGS domain-containing protein n=1 Tax=Ophiocordyceps polyrhachis-furcata BCC 54312 TaxID=1330021 RepID=A0A367L856_9HYPO|nr:hypothetical protein L249_4268 [Ophiocordyceps polyrhachis-furcata BCC 54312]
MINSRRKSRRSSAACLKLNQQLQSLQSGSASPNSPALDGSDSSLANFTSLRPICTPQDTMTAKPPTLEEILLDVAPPPWTLSAFMAYLSQNHCLETLEFTLDSQHYSDLYNQLPDNSHSDDIYDQLCSWWRRLLQTYIVPCAPREVNIPSRVRDRLLTLPYGPHPPHPSELDESGKIIHELMNDSLLVPFLQSVAPLHYSGSRDDNACPPRHQSQNNAARATGTPVRIETEGLTDDSDSNSPTLLEPMTPPTTPPTSEYTFNTSPGGLQRAVAAHSRGWKTLGAKLGFNRKSVNRRSTPSGTDFDATFTEADLESES